MIRGHTQQAPSGHEQPQLGQPFELSSQSHTDSAYYQVSLPTKKNHYKETHYSSE